MRVVAAIDQFLEQMRIERDWTPRTIDSYRRVLVVIADTLFGRPHEDTTTRGC